MIPLAIIGGIGAGAIDAGLNTWVERHLDPHIMHWLHGSYGIGISSGPFIMTIGLNLSQNWRPGYWIVGGIQILLACVFLSQIHRWSKAPHAAHTKNSDGEIVKSAPFNRTIRQLKSWSSALLFFIYTGVEIGMGFWAYSWMTKTLGYNHTEAGIWTGLYWIMFTISRLSAGWLNMRIPSRRLLLIAISSSVFMIFMIAFLPWIWLKGPLLAALGFCIAPIFPAMVSTTAERVGRAHAQNTIGMQMSMAGLGAGILPGAIGVIGEQFGLAIIPWIVFGLSIILLMLLILFQKLQIKKE
jgi:fucose permease